MTRRPLCSAWPATVLVCATALVLFALPAAASAETGALTWMNCVMDAGASTACGVSQEGLMGAFDVAVSADGKSVYAVSDFDDSIARLDRNPATGALTPQGCIADVGMTNCGVYEPGMNGPTGVAVSPDGKSVYVTSASAAIVRFDRDPGTGTLTGAGCIDDLSVAVCGVGNSIEGLSGANDVVVSPDNKSVYVVSRTDGTLVRFDRDTVTGALTPQGCFADATNSICGPSTEQQGLTDAYGVAVSPDGKSVYVASRGEGAIVRFDRNLTTGALTPQGCVADVGATDCGGSTQNGLGGAHHVTVSPDNESVYVAAGNDDAIVRFDRDTVTGALTPQGCISDTGTSVGCAATAQGLDKAYELAVSSDGKSVYVLGASDHALARFDRDTGTGALTAQGCFQAAASSCASSAPGLSVPYGIAISPDGASVYVTGWASHAIVRFFRATDANPYPPVDTPAGPPPPPADPPPPSNDFTFENPFSLPRNGTVTYSFELPAGGTILVHAKGKIKGPPRVYPSVAGTAASKTITIAKKRVTVSTAGTVRVKLKPTKAAMKALRRSGRLKSTVRITFTPAGGSPKTVTDKVTFRLKRR